MVEPNAPPLAEPTSERHHMQYPNILDHLRKLPILLLTSLHAGIGKSIMLRQAAEQLVMGTQLIFLPSVYTSFGLHPSVLYAYANGGIIVISDTTYDCYERSLHFASQLLSGNPFIGLDQPVRPECHPDFRLVLEYRNTLMPTRITMNPVLQACVQQIEVDMELQRFLIQATFSTQKERDSLVKLLSFLPNEEQYSLHPLGILRSLTTGEERAGFLRRMLANHPDVSTTAQLMDQRELLLEPIGKSKQGRPAAPRAPKEIAVTEQHSPEEQAAALQQVVAGFEHPTVKPAVDPVAEMFGLEQTEETLDEDLGF